MVSPDLSAISNNAGKTPRTVFLGSRFALLWFLFRSQARLRLSTRTSDATTMFHMD
jgi:hypothetical protein